MSNLLLYFFVICCMLSSMVECFPEIQAMIKAVLGKSNLRKLGIKNPTAAPIPVPSQNPSIKPTRAPVTKSPSLSPSFKPTPGPPTKHPSRFPSFRPSQTKKPSPAPTSYSPTAQPTLRPTKAPTTRAPSTTRPTKGPTTSRPTYSLAPTYPPGTLVASWTYYNSYPRCCASQPNYDPSYPTTECTDYSGCAHPGLFAGIGQRSLDYVQATDMIAFYDNNDPSGANFQSTWANKLVTITGTCNGVTKTFTAVIADTCGNSDCNNCCARNSHPTTGYLIDMEYYTAMRQFGTTNCADGAHSLTFEFDFTQPLAMVNCGEGIGSCNGAQRCCSAEGYCETTASACGSGCQKSYGYCANNSGTCGPSSGKSCRDGQCCSKYGYCGTGSDFCSSGCQSGYGTCS